MWIEAFREIMRFVGAGLIAVIAVASLRVIVDLWNHGDDRIASRRDPANYDDKLTRMWVDKDGKMQFRTKRVYRWKHWP